MAMVTTEDVMARLEDGKLRPEVGSVYEGMTRAEMAVEYLNRCKDVGVCAGCYNRLDDEDRAFGGEDTNECISCACY